MSADKRAAPRHAVELVAEVDTPTGFVPARTRDVSASGVGLLTRDALPEGVELPFALFLTRDGIESASHDPLSIRGSVMWCAEQADGTFLAGARFGKLSAAQEARLARFLAELGAGQNT